MWKQIVLGLCGIVCLSIAIAALYGAAATNHFLHGQWYELPTLIVCGLAAIGFCAGSIVSFVNATIK